MEREKESEKVMVYCALNDTVKLLHRALNICEEQKNEQKPIDQNIIETENWKKKN